MNLFSRSTRPRVAEERLGGRGEDSHHVVADAVPARRLLALGQFISRTHFASLLGDGSSSAIWHFIAECAKKAATHAS